MLERISIQFINPVRLGSRFDKSCIFFADYDAPKIISYLGNFMVMLRNWKDDLVDVKEPKIIIALWTRYCLNRVGHGVVARLYSRDTVINHCDAGHYEIDLSEMKVSHVSYQFSGVTDREVAVLTDL